MVSGSRDAGAAASCNRSLALPFPLKNTAAAAASPTALCRLLGGAAVGGQSRAGAVGWRLIHAVLMQGFAALCAVFFWGGGTAASSPACAASRKRGRRTEG